MEPAGTPPAWRLSSARRAFALHGWLGLSLGLPLLVICLSGALAVFGHELDWLRNPAMRSQPGGPRLSLDAIHAKVQRAFPEAHIAYWQLSDGSRFADELSLQPRVANGMGGQRETRVYVSPHTGAIQGVSGYLNVRSFLRAFHYYWFDTVTGWGFFLVAAFAFVLLGSVLTGMAIYKRWWAGLFTLRMRRGRRVFFSDLHKLCGAWTLAFNFVIALTDIYYLDHYGNSAHFPGHAVVLAGYDDEVARLSDTGFEELQTTRLENLAKARHSGHPAYPLEGHMFTVSDAVGRSQLEAAIPGAIKQAAREMLEPTFGEFGGLLAVDRLAAEAGSWPEAAEDWQWCARFAYQVIERRGTGGGAFRLMYSRFLEEARRGEAPLAAEAAARWTELAEAFKAASESDVPEPALWDEVGAAAKRVAAAETRLWTALSG